MKSSLAWLVLAILLAVSAGAQQQASPESVPLLLANSTVLYLELSKSIDAKKARPGDEISAILLADVVAHGKIVLRTDSRLQGHVTEAQAHTSDNPESRLGIVFDKVTPKGSRDAIAFRSVLLAVRAAPRLQIDSMSAPAPPGTTAPPQERHYPTPKGPSVPAPMSSRDPASQTDREKIRSGGNALDLTPTDIDGLSLVPSTDGANRVVVSYKRTVKLESGVRLELRVTDAAPVKAE